MGIIEGMTHLVVGLSVGLLVGFGANVGHDGGRHVSLGIVGLGGGLGVDVDGSRDGGNIGEHILGLKHLMGQGCSNILRFCLLLRLESETEIEIDYDTEILNEATGK